jgi:uncharacterized membrane protein YjfL (UPF0719 family)
MPILREYLITFGWAVTGAISMAVALGIALAIFAWFTPINDWEEIKKGNLAMAIVLGATIIAFAIVVSKIAV